MGFARYYRSFIEGLSRVAYPITSLQKKGRIFKWIVECQNCFNELNHLLNTTPILRIDDPNKEFTVL